MRKAEDEKSFLDMGTDELDMGTEKESHGVDKGTEKESHGDR